MGSIRYDFEPKDYYIEKELTNVVIVVIGELDDDFDTQPIRRIMTKEMFHNLKNGE